MTTIAYPHIEIRDQMPMISGTQTKVVEIVLDRLAHNWDADEIHRQHPHLTLGQIHSALAYYYDHQAEMNRLIEARFKLEERLAAEFKDPEFQAKVRAKVLAFRKSS